VIPEPVIFVLQMLIVLHALMVFQNVIHVFLLTNYQAQNALRLLRVILNVAKLITNTLCIKFTYKETLLPLRVIVGKLYIGILDSGGTAISQDMVMLGQKFTIIRVHEMY